MSINEAAEELHRALAVLTEDPRHVEWLAATDPKGLKQALLARREYLYAKLDAMERPLGNGPGISMGKSVVRMSIGEEIERLDAKLTQLGLADLNAYKIACRFKAQHGAGGTVFTVQARSYGRAVKALLADHPEINPLTCSLVRD